MAYPILAAQDTWWKPNVSSVTRASITEIEIMDSYTPDSSVTVVDSWDASEAKDGSITCYIIGTKLIMAGNGSGKISINQDSRGVFTDMTNWFKNPFESVNYISGLDLFYTSHITNMTFWFYGMKSIENIDLSGLDLLNLDDINTAFCQCSSLKSVEFGVLNNEKPINFAAAFHSCESLISLDLSKYGPLNISGFNCICEYCASLESFHLTFASCTDPYGGAFSFNGCKKLNNLILDNFNPSEATTMEAMFQHCQKLKNINISNWDLSKCTSLAFMFYGCSSLGEIDVSNWDVSKVTNFDHFAAHANLKRKGIEKWNTSSATNMNAMFHNCAEEELDLSGFDTSKVQFFCQMFEASPNLKRIKGLEKWDTSAGLGFDGMFERCYVLEELDLSSFDTSKAKNDVKGSVNGHKTATLQNMFLSCNNLRKVTLGNNFAVNGDGTNTAAANMLTLPTPSTDYIEGADGVWYTFNGDSYVPNAIPDRPNNTFYASYTAVADMDVIVKNGSLIETARAIREKNGATDQYTPAQFGGAIRSMAVAIAGQTLAGQVDAGEV